MSLTVPYHDLSSAASPGRNGRGGVCRAAVIAPCGRLVTLTGGGSSPGRVEGGPMGAGR
jgi:hypothetical protein